MIRVKTLLVCFALFALPAVASAQTSFYGTLACGEEDPPPPVAGKAFHAGENAGAKNGRERNGAEAKSARAADRSTAASSKSGPAASVAQEKCSWTLPLQIGSDTVQGGENTFNLNVEGSLSKDTGTHTGHTINGDQFTLSLTGSTVWDANGTARSRDGAWTFTGGTGMLKGIAGSGTYSGLARAQGGMTYDVEGNYEFPATPVVPPPPAAASSPKAASPS